MAKAGLPIKKASTPVPVKIVHDTARPTIDKGYEERERRYRAESALETIQRAETHKKDKELMKDVKKLGREKMSALKKIC